MKVGLKLEMATEKIKLKDIPNEELKKYFEFLKEIYKKAKEISILHKIMLPEEDFWDFIPGTSNELTEPEKQITQHTLLAVLQYKI